VKYKVAASISEVLEAWCIVYKQYLAASLITPNEMSVFTFPEYISNNTAVILGQKMGQTVCTASAVLDGPQGLPLDNYYTQELDILRSQDKKLIEIGLLADSRGTNSMSSLTDLMAGIARFGVYSDHHDFVIGVHPRRAKFFNKIFGFDILGEVKGYGKLETAPVVLLHALGTDFEVISKKVNTEIYFDPKDFNFGDRYQFNPNNFISKNEFGESVENFIKILWKEKTLQTA
jgi:hypothetical protein